MMNRNISLYKLSIAVFSIFSVILTCEGCVGAVPPVPVLPVLSSRQMDWQKNELIMFAHFGIKTYYPNDNHIGTGEEDPRKFSPQKLDVHQWVRAAKAGGFEGIILTAKHNDGFCNWQTQTTDFSVKSSPWKDGKGQRVAEHQIEFWDGSAWQKVISGTKIGYNRIHFKKFKAQRARLVITRSRACPLISTFSVIRSPM